MLRMIIPLSWWWIFRDSLSADPRLAKRMCRNVGRVSRNILPRAVRRWPANSCNLGRISSPDPDLSQDQRRGRTTLLHLVPPLSHPRLCSAVFISSNMDSSSRIQAIGLLHLPGEIIGRASAYLQIQGGDVKNLVAVVGTRNRDAEFYGAIRHWHLKDNAAYVEHLYWSKKLTDAATVAHKLRDWIGVNKCWRNACRPYLAEDGVHTALQKQIFKDVTLYPEFVGNSSKKKTRGGRVTLEYNSDRFGLHVQEESLERFPKGSAIVGIDGVDVTRGTYEHVQTRLNSILLLWTEQKIRVVSEAFEFFFFNPSVAIDLGMYDIFQYLLEDVELDCNSRCTGFRFYWRGRHSDGFLEMPILVHALVHPDSRFFDHLIAIDGIDPNPVLIPDLEQGGGRTLVQALGEGSTLNKDSLVKDVLDEASTQPFLDRIELILRRDDVDVDSSFNNVWSVKTPLVRLVCSFGCFGCFGNDHPRLNLQLARIFLNAGASADSLLHDGRFKKDVWRNMRGYRSTMAKLIEATNREERDAIISSLRPLKRKR